MSFGDYSMCMSCAATLLIAARYVPVTAVPCDLIVTEQQKRSGCPASKPSPAHATWPSWQDNVLAHTRTGLEHGFQSLPRLHFRLRTFVCLTFIISSDTACSSSERILCSTGRWHVTAELLRTRAGTIQAQTQQQPLLPH